MQGVNDFLKTIDSFIGGSFWFVLLLLGVGLFFTVYLKFPQFRYMKHSLKIVRGKFDKKDDAGDTSHFQALATALSGTVGTGNIAGVAFAIYLGGPAALFWMLMTAMIGMTTKFVEVTLSHKYRDFAEDGLVSGGPMYYMKKRLNIKLNNGKVIKSGVWMGAFFAVATILSSFGTGSLPQINSISNSIFDTFGLKHIITGGVLAVLLGFVIIGGIKRIAKVTEKLVPGMAIIYFIGAILVLGNNLDNIIPSIVSIFRDVFTGTAAAGGFLGATFIYAFNRGVNRGLFSNEAGQGSAPIAHAAARAHEPVSEGMVAILEPFIDTIIICFLTGMVILSSGVWNEKFDNKFQEADMYLLSGVYSESVETDRTKLMEFISLESKDAEYKNYVYNGELNVEEGIITNELTVFHARSIAESVEVYLGDELYTGSIDVVDGKVEFENEMYFQGQSLKHSAPLTTEAFKRGFLGDGGKYIISIGLLLFAFSTAISWSYYGGRAVTYLFGAKYVIVYRFVYVIAFFLASFTDTTIIWTLSGITIACMTIPNLIGIFSLHKEMKSTVKSYWIDFHKENPDVKIPEKVDKYKN
ncbi:alanine/glycine:cation symporter family protein [Bacteroidota bacterium]